MLIVAPRQLVSASSPWWLPAWSSEPSDHPGSSRGSPGPAGNLPAGKDPALRAGSLIHPAGTLPAHTVTAAP